MKITFKDKKLRKLCEVQKEAQKKLGAKCARKLRSRLADLIAAETVSELASGRPHPLKGKRAGEFALDLDGGKRLVFELANDTVPLNEDGSIDWSKVTFVCIVFIGDYHD
ncbi:MAG: type II toxin-antitoxin system RelE/ParE family toxin [Xenococcus sp. (in: cyanobacteria)]